MDGDDKSKSSNLVLRCSHARLCFLGRLLRCFFRLLSAGHIRYQPLGESFVLDVKPVEYGYQHGAPAPVPAAFVAAPAVHVATSAPLGGSFVAHIVSNRHHKHISFEDMQLSFCHEPTRWLFQPCAVPGAFLISILWSPGAAAVPLELLRAPGPAFWRAVNQAEWEVRLGSSPATEDYLWTLEQTHHGVAIRNVASGMLLCAERVLRANRAVAREWESFSVVALTEQQQAVPWALPVVDPLLTMAVNVRVRLRSVRYGSLLGLKGRHRVRWSRRSAEWDLLAVPGQDAYRIVNAHHPRVSCRTDGSGFVDGGEGAAGAAELFVLERNGANYALRSLATGRVCTALCSGLVANRREKKMWEELVVEVVQQVPREAAHF